jgi:hypothetical protein
MIIKHAYAMEVVTYVAHKAARSVLIIQFMGICEIINTSYEFQLNYLYMLHLADLHSP